MADVAGYSRLIGIDDEGTLAQLNSHHAELIQPKIKEHRGRIVRTTGDGLLVLFVSAVDALRCAVEIQRAMPERNAKVPTESRRAVHIYRVLLDQTDTKARPSLPISDKPSIAVLPFTNLSGDPTQEYFADGMVEDIITGLSRFRWLFVIARNSSFTYKGRAVDVKQVGRELGVRYLLEGSVRKSTNRIRIAGQLIDTSSGSHLWAHRFEGAIENVFELQDQVTASVVGAIAPRLEQAEMERARRKPTESLDAYDLFLRGQANVYKWTREGHEE